ncbi:hypothetical protein PMAYCL1PPCAC_22701 [Pristionchus mayeri]|uniref:Uncharacterized protein n=1 Tax=Pristionchus mayeri TaxID=1317129 RepID=A0AAN5CWU1_9BILA|nr:hypothetical protein PMAYCL1PPCAC_22701 [Pristionchus mayeri]
MRLLVPTRMSLALRRATSSPVPAATRNQHSRGAAAQSVPQQELLQQLWELSKTQVERESFPQCLSGIWLAPAVKSFSARNGFTDISKLLEDSDKSEYKLKQGPNATLINEVIWSAIRAKSFGALPPPTLKWIEGEIMQLPEPLPTTKESIIWLLSILRDDWPHLQQLQQESISQKGRVGPEIKREETLRHLALAYLQAGKMEEFRSLWTSSRTPLLDGEDQLRNSALLHHAMLRSVLKGKSDPAMLRWYAQSLVEYQRTPIEEEPQFKTMMEPMIRLLGGKIEKWAKHDPRLEKLRKWRVDYEDCEMDKLIQSLLDYMKHAIFVKKHGSRNDLNRLERMLARLEPMKRMEGKEKRKTVVVDWLNLDAGGGLYRQTCVDMDSFFPQCSLVVVGREKGYRGDSTPRSPKESERIKVMEVTAKREKKQELDDVCSLILAVATRGYLLSNDRTKPHIQGFKEYLQSESNDQNLSTLFENYLNDAVVRHDGSRLIEPMVDHSRAAQWIDKEKKELAFTVARKPYSRWTHPFRYFDYYSLHID